MKISLRKKGMALLLLSAFLLAACQSDSAPTDGAKKGAITVGVSSSFAENEIVAEMYAQVLEKAGYKVKRQLKLKSREISEPALERGEIDVVPEYLGSLLVFLDKNAAASSDATQTAAALSKLISTSHPDIELLEPSKANDTNAFAVTRKTADEKKLTKVSDLAPIAGQLTLGGPPECPQRPFCLVGLKDKYGVTFKEFKPLDVGGPITVSALEGGEIDVALLFTTSGVLKKKGFVLLEDDKGLQQADNITPLVNKKVLNDEVRELLNGVSAQLTSENISELNGKVEIDKEDPADVAEEFLGEKELI
ncbi:MAG: ABC transporter substrate-binding protein [Actinomycetota bacterium]